MPTDADLLSKMAAARLWAAAQQPYLASALFAAPVLLDTECGTIAVDRAWNIHADPAHVDRFEAPQLGALLLHLISHLLRAHADRAQRVGVEEDNQREWWNRCGDAEINDDLARTGILPPVAADLPFDFGANVGELVEAYYERPAAGPRQWDCGSGCDDGDRPWDCDGLPHDQRQLLRLDTAAEIHRCHAREPGTVPGGWLRWAETLLPAQVDWRRVLAAHVRRELASTAGRVDYTYRRPSRRQDTVADVVMPALHRPTPNVAIVCDTSGSMHDELLARALAEVEGILTRAGLRQGNVRVLAVDTNVHAVTRVTRAADVALAGGGGTDMGAGIAAATELRPKPSLVVVLTDGYTPWPAQAPKGAKVIVGVLEQPGWPPGWDPPPWATTIPIGPDLPASAPPA
ncbi:MAG: VWA domain-containing protein [Actinobacteria bacterium]|nr:VWA domain-containing protein [Actinomycetota bacterium]